MIRSANGIAESLGAVLLLEDLAVVESEVVREIRGGHRFPDRGHELFVEHVFDVIYTLGIGLDDPI
jgi:hypothetical protein